MPPALPTTGTPAPSLARQFYRVAIVDTVWALLGNRTQSAELGVDGDDGSIPADLLPQVRDQVVITYLVDGLDTLAKASAAKDRVAVFHPVGFPGRVAYIRTTNIVVDDVWVLTGATHFRRRGMTFDGSAAIASFDRTVRDGYSSSVRDFRRRLMAAKLAIPDPGTGSPTADWLRLGHGESAFQLVSDWLAEGGLGAILPFWPGPADTSVLSASDATADPDGTDPANFVTLFANLIGEVGD